MAGLGASTSNVDLAMSTVYAHNRESIDDDADRRFFVRGGLEVPIEDVPDTARPPVHPEHEDRGRREIPVGDSVLLEEGDYPDAGERVWLKGLACVRRAEGVFVGTGDDIDAVREEGVPVVHWVPASESVPLRLRTMNGDVSGHAEPGVLDHPVDDVVQFERIGFARIDSVAPREEDLVSGQTTETDGERAETVAYFAHR
jgi:glutamyl-tRNA synthetase